MGSVWSHISTAFQHAVHELIVSVFDLLIYMAVIILALLLGKMLALTIKSIFKCAAIPRAVSTGPLKNAFTPVSSKYHPLP
ncbi:E protein [DeBrazza's monkey arterivirus]|uniref:E protein n=1 Tax=DeBrazza's monkey arterivirus TaxID=1965063 RepID=A0A0B6CDH3_9NIDO|nr:E protein [DeBrazza's monkey arterivirus]AJI43730.1 E protein [DeBrazza's monkey arterivirus]